MRPLPAVKRGLYLAPFDGLADPRLLAELDVRQWKAAGATWVLTSFEPQPPVDVVRDVIEAGP